MRVRAYVCACVWLAFPAPTPLTHANLMRLCGAQLGGESTAGAQRLKEWVGAHLRPAIVPLDPTDEGQLSEL